MGDKDISLDLDAQSLFEQFGGMETRKDSPRPEGGADRLAESLKAEQKRLDDIRILLIHMAFLISRYLKDGAFAAGDTAEPKVFSKLSNVLTKLGNISGHLGCAFVRYRGSNSVGDLPQKYDYELIIGNTVVDSLMAPGIARRSGAKMADLPDRLLDAFTVFADYGVNNIFLKIPAGLSQHLPGMRLCLKILSGFRQSRQSGDVIRVDIGGKERSLAVVNDENLFPDANLTLLAGLNRVKTKSMELLVHKVDQWLRNHKKKDASNRYAGIYNALLEFPKIQGRLKKPMVEMNNVKWLVSETQEETVTLEKAYVARLAFEMAGSAPQKVAKMINAVYGDDYAKIDKSLLGERLHLSSDLLSAAQTRSEKNTLSKEVLGNLNQKLDQVKDHVIDEVHVRQDTGEASQPPGTVHKHVYQMVEFYKGRSTARKKMVGMVHGSIEFTDRDYAILAKDFRIDNDDAVALVEKLKGCFAQGGRFRKNGFYAALDHFKQYEQKIFGFLWHHMKDAIVPEDRVLFLNSLQELTAHMKQPKRAFKTLLEDICSDPDKVQFSDNKAVMLANLIVHRPDKSLANYEITPEDIVLNRQNLDPMVVQYASWRIEKEKDPFFTKVETIHKMLAEALCLGDTTQHPIPIAVLLNLERELFIFLSMVVCDTGKTILRSAVAEYGDPRAEIYHHKESGTYMGGIMQNLRVSLRGLGAVGEMSDVSTLKAVKEHNEDFQRLKNDRQFRAQARLVTEWADEAIKIIKFNS